MTVNEKGRGSNPTYDTTETIDYLAINIARKIQEPHEENDELGWRDQANGEIHGGSEWELPTGKTSSFPNFVPK